MGYGRIWQRITDTVYAPHCLLCGAHGSRARDICTACERDLPGCTDACRLCAAPLPPADSPRTLRVCGRCTRRPPQYRRAHAAFIYAPPLDYLVQRFKFGGRLECGRLLGQLFAERVSDTLAVDCLLPVPLHASRLRVRGFNQAQILAGALGRAQSVPVLRGLLVRVRATPAQTALSADRRHRNVRDAFTTRASPRGLRIGVVDDVLTTGATVDEAARILRRDGAADVLVYALARAQTPSR